MRDLTPPVQQRLHFGEVDIFLRSNWKQEFKKEDEVVVIHQRNFFFNQKTNPDIVVDVELAKDAPRYHLKKRLFLSQHPENKQEWWSWERGLGVYIYRANFSNRKQVAFINPDFKYARVWCLPKDDGSQSWQFGDLLLTFLEVLLIHYLIHYKKGLLVHACGINDALKGGLLFLGASGTGKSTLARLWYHQNKKEVLNDDRIIVAKKNKVFFIYPTLWSGEFNKYLSMPIRPAPLKAIFFLRKSKQNYARPILPSLSLSQLLPATFIPFWDKLLSGNALGLCEELLNSIPVFSLDFVKSRSVVGYIKRLEIKRF